jgi:hypothetical protein
VTAIHEMTAAAMLDAYRSGALTALEPRERAVRGDAQPP